MFTAILHFTRGEQILFHPDRIGSVIASLWMQCKHFARKENLTKGLLLGKE